MKLELPFPPSLNRLYRSGLKNACKRCRREAIPISYPSDEYQDYQAQLAVVLRAKRLTPVLKPAQVIVTVHLFRPRGAGDTDNYLKGLLDVLSGHVYEDDSQIAEIHCVRHEDKLRPRVELDVVEIPSAQGSLL